MMMNIKKRIDTIFQNHQDELDAIIIKNGAEQFIDVNFFYVTGLSYGLFESSILIIFPDATLHIITTSLEKEIADQSSAIVHVFQSKHELGEILQRILIHTEKIGIHGSGLLYSDYQFLKNHLSDKQFIDVTSSIHKSRMIKDQDEIEIIRNACNIADTVMEKIVSMINENMTENDLASEIDYALQCNGAEQPAFATISSFGSHTSLPHYSHGEKTLKHGDFILCDFGARYQKYNSDMTRTFIFGAASKRQHQIHETVKQAQQKAFNIIRPGIPAKTVHDQVQRFIDGTHFKGCFIHSTGHSLGLSVHDPGVSLSSNCDVILEENMVLTVEPGIYIQGFGGVRIEDDILITKNGCERLTKTPQMLIEI